MSVVANCPGITWDNTRAMTLEELRLIVGMIERMHRG